MQRQTSILLATLALALAVVPGVAHAQGGDADVRCLMVSNTFAQKETDAQRKQLALASVSFYLGRVDARLSAAQFKAAVTALTKEGPRKDFGEMMTACAKTVLTKQVATSQMVQDIAKATGKK